MTEGKTQAHLPLHLPGPGDGRVVAMGQDAGPDETQIPVLHGSQATGASARKSLPAVAVAGAKA